jgi:hypothetical protein
MYHFFIKKVLLLTENLYIRVENDTALYDLILFQIFYYISKPSYRYLMMGLK